MNDEAGLDPQNLAEQLQQMQRQLEETQQALENEMVEVTAGGGDVRIKMSGTQRCHEVGISQDLLDSGDAEMLQRLVLLAVNQAIHESQVMAARRLGPAASGLIPGGGAVG